MKIRGKYGVKAQIIEKNLLKCEKKSKNLYTHK